MSTTDASGERPMREGWYVSPEDIRKAVRERWPDAYHSDAMTHYKHQDYGPGAHVWLGPERYCVRTAPESILLMDSANNLLGKFGTLEVCLAWVDGRVRGRVLNAARAIGAESLARELCPEVFEERDALQARVAERNRAFDELLLKSGGAYADLSDALAKAKAHITELERMSVMGCENPPEDCACPGCQASAEFWANDKRTPAGGA